jgi:hypothetical protein
MAATETEVNNLILKIAKQEMQARQFAIKEEQDNFSLSSSNII